MSFGRDDKLVELDVIFREDLLQYTLSVLDTTRNNLTGSVRPDKLRASTLELFLQLFSSLRSKLGTKVSTVSVADQEYQRSLQKYVQQLDQFACIIQQSLEDLTNAANSATSRYGMPSSYATLADSDGPLLVRCFERPSIFEQHQVDLRKVSFGYHQESVNFTPDNKFFEVNSNISYE